MACLLPNMCHIKCGTRVYQSNLVAEQQPLVSDHCLISVPNYEAIYQVILKQRQILQILSACCRHGQGQILMTLSALMYESYLNFMISSHGFYVLYPCLYVHRIASRPDAWVPQCISPTSHSAPYYGGGMHMCAHLCCGVVHLWDVCLVHCGICEMGLLPWANRSVCVGYSRWLTTHGRWTIFLVFIYLHCIYLHL